LHSYIKLILIPPDLVKSLTVDEINDTYIQNLQKLDGILKNLKNPEIPPSKAIKDQMPEIEKLKLKIISRIRNFLIASMEALKKPRTNTQIIQQNVLLKFKDLNKFLMNHAQGIFIEVSNYYCDLMCGLYLNIFKSYITEISKLYDEKVTKYENIIVDESEYINATIQKKQSAFDLAGRDKVLGELHKEPIIYHISVEQKLLHNLEEIFRSQNKLLVDATINEYYFVLEFFGLQPQQCSYIFNAIFKKPVQFFLDNLQNTVSYSFDPQGLLLMVQINEKFKNFHSTKNVPILDFYFDKVDFILWPRIVQILDGHITVIKNAISKNYLKPVATTVTAITKRYVELASGIYKITKEKSQAMLQMRMSQLKSAMLDLLKNMSEKFPAEKVKFVFMLNNLDYICNEFKMLGIEKFEDFNSLVKEYEQLAPKYVKLLISQEFKSLLDVVYKYATEANSEGTMQLLSPDELKTVNKSYLENVANDFALSYAKKIESIRQTINLGINSKQSAKELFGNLLKDLMEKYAAFGEIVRIGHLDYFKELTGQHVLLDLKSLFNSLKHEIESPSSA